MKTSTNAYFNQVVDFIDAYMSSSVGNRHAFLQFSGPSAFGGSTIVDYSKFEDAMATQRVVFTNKLKSLSKVPFGQANVARAFDFVRQTLLPKFPRRTLVLLFTDRFPTDSTWEQTLVALNLLKAEVELVRIHNLADGTSNFFQTEFNFYYAVEDGSRMIDLINSPSFLCNTQVVFLPTAQPTSLSRLPSSLPTLMPSMLPTELPHIQSTQLPSQFPTMTPSLLPTAIPSLFPTSIPSLLPTSIPSLFPTSMPSLFPTSMPSLLPTSIPSLLPTLGVPSRTPSLLPTSQLPTTLPTTVSSLSPTSLPTRQLHFPPQRLDPKEEVALNELQSTLFSNSTTTSIIVCGNKTKSGEALQVITCSERANLRVVDGVYLQNADIQITSDLISWVLDSFPHVTVVDFSNSQHVGLGRNNVNASCTAVQVDSRCYSGSVLCTFPSESCVVAASPSTSGEVVIGVLLVLGAVFGLVGFAVYRNPQMIPNKLRRGPAAAKNISLPMVVAANEPKWVNRSTGQFIWANEEDLATPDVDKRFSHFQSSAV